MKYIIFLLLSLSLKCIAQDTLYLNLNNNSQLKYSTTDVNKMTFRSDTMVIHLFNGTQIEFSVTDIGDCSFQNPVLQVIDIKNSQINLYPNPVVEYLNVSHPSKITIYDALSNKVIETDSSQIDCRNLTPGQYIAIIEIDTHRLTYKFIKL